ncbi:MAG TPA: ribosomal protein S18-alanine N-acetyltransferase [Candidatus Obscuribacterales bacterium]
MPCLELHPLTTQHLAAVVRLDQLCFGGIWTQEGYQREVTSPNSDLLMLQRSPSDATDDAPSNPTLIGIACCWAILDEAHITLLGIHPHYQRQGLGQLALLTLLSLARHRGLQWATLEVRDSNQAARSLYARYDFQDVGRRRRYYADTGEDALILWCKGLQTDDFGDRLQHHWQHVHQRLQQHNWQLTSSLDAIAPFLWHENRTP